MGKRTAMDESALGMVPSIADYQETTQLFQDFCIRKVEIPKFSSRGQLIRWRTSTIQTHLSRGR